MLDSGRADKIARKSLQPEEKSPKLEFVVETTDEGFELGHYGVNGSGRATRHPHVLREPTGKSNKAKASEEQTKGSLFMQEISSRHPKAGRAFHHGNIPFHSFAKRKKSVFRLSDLSLIQKILIANLLIILSGAIIGSYLTAQLAEAGQFNFMTYLIIIVTAVTLSGASSFGIMKLAFRPFEELQRVIDKIHTGNPRARATLRNLSDPDVRHFTSALNQMLSRLEENARVIQEDQRQLQLMTARVINAQENERKRIARELHDEASQALTAMIMGLESARQDAPADNKLLQAKFDGLKELANGTLEELRKLALDLRPTMLDDLGLLPAIRWLSRTAAERAALDIKVKVDGFEESERLAPEVETCLFRITQESLTNITRHAAARKVEIRLERLAAFETEGEGWGAVRLTVKDDGKGFRPAEAKVEAYQGGHLGLFDIEERAALLGGKVEIESRCAAARELPGGTTIIVTVPLSGRPVNLSGEIDTHARPYTQPEF